MLVAQKTTAAAPHGGLAAGPKLIASSKRFAEDNILRDTVSDKIVTYEAPVANFLSLISSIGMEA